MAVFVHSRHRTSGDKNEVRLIPVRGGNAWQPPRPRALRAEAMSDARGEATHGTMASLTLAFLLAGVVIVSALVWWSGPDAEQEPGIGVEHAGVAAQAR
jgi:hypothetical protein